MNRCVKASRYFFLPPSLYLTSFSMVSVILCSLILVNCQSSCHNWKNGLNELIFHEECCQNALVSPNFLCIWSVSTFLVVRLEFGNRRKVCVSIFLQLPIENGVKLRKFRLSCFKWWDYSSFTLFICGTNFPCVRLLVCQWEINHV